MTPVSQRLGNLLVICILAIQAKRESQFHRSFQSRNLKQFFRCQPMSRLKLNVHLLLYSKMGSQTTPLCFISSQTLHLIGVEHFDFSNFLSHGSRFMVL